MSHPDEPIAPPPPPAPVVDAPLEAPAVAAAAAEQLAPGASVLDPAAPSGAPYRVPAPPPALEPMAPELHFGPPPKKPRPLFGPALSVFAVLLWTFVVAGQFASSWKLGPQVRSGEASVVVLLLTFAAFVASLRRSGIAVPPRSMMFFLWRGIGVGLVAFILFALCVVAATAINSAMDYDFLVGVVLVLISLVAALVGPRLTTRAPIERTPRQRALQIMLWMGGTLLTFVAIVDLGANG